MFPATKPQQCVGAASLTSNVDAEAVNTTRYLPDLDSVANMKVCRVCLAMSVKMYHMSEHKLSDMYERVTGVEISTKDKLPQMLCWECVARLSSANKFKEKALKTQWILMNKINTSSIITRSDIESIDRAQYRLESTLGLKVYKENDSNLYSIKESDKSDENVYIEDHELNVKCEVEFCDLNDINNEPEIIIPEVNVTNEKDPIKKEFLDETEEKYVPDEVYVKDEIKFQNTNSLYITVEIEKKENINKEMTGQVNWSEALPHCEELKEDIEDVMTMLRQDSYNQLTAQSLTNGRTALHPQKKKENNFEENITIDVATTSTGTVENNISFPQNDTESSKHLLICDICGKQFHNRSTLTWHLMNHPKMHSCTYCNYKACQRTDLKKHINRMHTKTISFNCSFCSYTAYAKSTLTRHVDAKHSNTDGYNCSFCSYRTYQKCTLTRHVNAKHTKKEVYTCSLCSYTAHDKGILNRHVNAKHTKANTYNCPHCDYTAYNKSNLTIHVEVKHTKTNVYNCPHCSHVAYYKGALTRHVNAKHTKANVYNCSHCNYETSDKSGLVRHVNARHTKKITYNCSLCSYKAYQKSSLSGHINAIHTKTKVYKCSLCSYAAYHKSNLSGHINAKHTKTTAYNCSLCGYKTYHRSNLTAHVNSKHTTSTVGN